MNPKVSTTSVDLLRYSTLSSPKMFEDVVVKEVQDVTERSIRFGTSANVHSHPTRIDVEDYE